jgi:hypothetical protein
MSDDKVIHGKFPQHDHHPTGDSPFAELLADVLALDMTNGLDGLVVVALVKDAEAFTRAAFATGAHFGKFIGAMELAKIDLIDWHRSNQE